MICQSSQNKSNMCTDSMDCFQLMQKVLRNQVWIQLIINTLCCMMTIFLFSNLYCNNHHH